ncbi:MAG: Rne/Rng family ribonuclease [Candidatus Melainabacteria bacterium]|nr:Rne/Rng family ribonuclease [Candidatus Melainabacteria bacterium]
MRKALVIAEQDNIAALLENDRVVEFFVNRGELLLGDIYTATVENILPGIDAAFVNLGKDKMGFLHANDVPGQGPLKERLVPKQKLLVQITKEPTGHKGPRVSTAISLPGRFLVLVPEERGVSISRRISEARERARLKSIVNLLKPPGVGLIIRTEAKAQGEPELFEDFEQLWDHWQTIVSDAEASIGPKLIYRDQDLLYRVIRDAYSTDIAEIVVDTTDGQRRAQEFLAGWTMRGTQVVLHTGNEPLLVARNIDREIESALSDRVDLPSGGHLNIQPTEALTVIDVNSGRFTSSRTQAETVRRTNLEAAQEIPRQLRLRNVGGMVIVDFIDMDSRKDQQQVLEAFQRCLEDDRAKPQIGQLSDLGLVELTRRRQGQSLRELFTGHCPTCSGLGVVPTLELGTNENKRVLNMKAREEEIGAKGRMQLRSGVRSQGAPLRAATVSSGRVQSTLVEVSSQDEAFAEVPEEILEQVPDDLLDEVSGKSGLDDSDFVSTGCALTADLSEIEVDEAYAQGVKHDLEGLDSEQLSPEVVESSWESTEPYTPYEAEPEQIAGVFRLKTKDVLPQPMELEAHDLSQQVAHDNGCAVESLVSELAESAGSQGELKARVNGELTERRFNYQEAVQPDTSRGEPMVSQGPWWSQGNMQQLELPLSATTSELSDAEKDNLVSANNFLLGGGSHSEEPVSTTDDTDEE